MACLVEDNDPSEIIFGCIDPLALNFNENATVDDGSCIYGTPDSLSGCTDPLAINYNDLAIYDDCSCYYVECPEGPFDIRPGDGAVFYTELLTTKGVNPVGQPQPIPTSVPLNQDCCTEEVVGQPVSWNGEFCVIPQSQCPGPFSSTIDGVILNSNGTPVSESCCGTLGFDEFWDPNYTSDTITKPGACLIPTPDVEECGLDITDIVYVGDTVVYDPNGSHGDVTPEGEDSGVGLVDDSYGCVGIENIQLANTDNIFIDLPSGVPPNTFLVVLGTTDTEALNLQVGQEIELTNFIDIINSCYNIPQGSINGVTTILKLTDLTSSGGFINIVTEIQLPYVEPNGCALEDLLVSVNASCCPVYVTTEPTDTTGGTGDVVFVGEQTCVNFKSFYYEPISTALQILGVNSTFTQLCGDYISNTNSKYLYMELTDYSDIVFLQECQTYLFDSTLVNAIDNDCVGVNFWLGTPSELNLKLILKYEAFYGGTNNAIAVFEMPNGLTIPNEGFSIGCAYGIGNKVNLSFSTCNPFIQGGHKSGTVVDTTKTLTGNIGKPILTSNFGDEIIPNFNNLDDPCNTTTLPGSPDIEYENLSEACCLQLGANLGWEYIDGVCYWNPPLPPADVIIGISENDIIVDNDVCTTLEICASVYLERPDNPKCYDANENVIINLLAYSGDINTNIFDVTQNSDYSSERDGYCTWVRICATINDYDGSPFKLKLNLSGTLDCCEYDVFVDDISVECSVQDSILVTNQFDCPGFDLVRTIDNKKSWVYNDGETINRQFAPSEDADIPWRYTDYYTQSNVLEKHSKLVLNSKELALTFNMCSLDECGEQINIFELIEYKKNFQNFWVKFIEQFIPATTIFVSGEKWCNTPSQICTVIDECGYENNFTLEELGIINVFNEPNTGHSNKSSITPTDVIESGSKLPFNGSGDLGNNNTDEPIIFDDHFYGLFIKEDPSLLVNEPLTFPRGLLPSLKSGRNNYKPPIVIFE